MCEKIIFDVETNRTDLTSCDSGLRGFIHQQEMSLDSPWPKPPMDVLCTCTRPEMIHAMSTGCSDLCEELQMEYDVSTWPQSPGRRIWSQQNGNGVPGVRPPDRAKLLVPFSLYSSCSLLSSVWGWAINADHQESVTESLVFARATYPIIIFSVPKSLKMENYEWNSEIRIPSIIVIDWLFRS